MLEEEAAERRLATLKQNTDREIVPCRDEPEGKASEQAASLFGTNRQYVSDAKRIAAEAPDVIDAIRAGQLSKIGKFILLAMLCMCRHMSTRVKHRPQCPVCPQNRSVWRFALHDGIILPTTAHNPLESPRSDR